MGLGSRFEGSGGLLFVFSWGGGGVLSRLDMECKLCQSSTLKYQSFFLLPQLLIQ